MKGTSVNSSDAAIRWGGIFFATFTPKPHTEPVCGRERGLPGWSGFLGARGGGGVTPRLQTLSGEARARLAPGRAAGRLRAGAGSRPPAGGGGGGDARCQGLYWYCLACFF